MTGSAPNSTPTYHHDDIQQILHLAIARQANGEENEFSRSQLLEIAEELGISADTLQLAEQEWQEQKHINYRYQEFDLYRHQQLKHKSGKYLIVSGFFFAIDFLSGGLGTITWSLYVLVSSGSLIALDAWKVYQMKGEMYQQAFSRWERKRQFKQSVGTFFRNVQKVIQG
ncbi:MAG: 2TM domain-containing protein [Jaaginema sp. PMC 1079.18]|nr:2TM domain-containing protein [Jaaginema sp. PMC 1080.18]MEC4853192.1 2TM domain-containing protein [Jaaginema sp. PMC 1079.18]MEC4864903.1 2TM domain-containing protein [Jaaginema sp. PMC 1078.18]